MAAAEDSIVTLLKKVATAKGVTLHGLEGDPIGINGVNDKGQQVGSIEVRKGGEKVGGISYAILLADVLVTQLKTRDITKEVQCIRIVGFNVTDPGKGLGSLLLASALFVGLANGCPYSVLDDMSEKYLEIEDNIYARFGFTHKDTLVIKDDKLAEAPMPEKQLELPNAGQMLRNFQAEFGMTGGKRKINCTALYKTRKVQAILNKAWKEQSEEVIKKTGTLGHFQWKDFKAGFKKGFMKRCKSRKAKRA